VETHRHGIRGEGIQRQERLQQMIAFLIFTIVSILFVVIVGVLEFWLP
jgi:hypothetical protein